MIRILSDKIRNLAGWRRTILVLLVGALTGLAMPPFHAWPILFVVLPIFVWVIDGSCYASKRAVFLTGWLFGFGYFAVTLHWIGFAFLIEAETYLWMMPFMVGALAAGMAIYWGLAILAMIYMWRAGLSRILLFASLMAIAEWLRGILFTGFPWASIGLAVEGMGAAAQLVSVFGMTGLTFLIVLWGALPAVFGDQWLTRRQIGAAVCLFALLPVGWVWGYVRLEQSHVAFVPNVKIRIVQPNISQDAKWRFDNAAEVFETLIAKTQGSDNLNGITHVIWPESSVPFLIDESEAALSRIEQALPDNTVLIMGADRRGPDQNGDIRFFNSIQGFDGFGNLVIQYDKWRLVPGGEYLPLEWLLAPLGFRKIVTVPGSFAAGDGPTTFSLPGAPPAGFLICYEVIFAQKLIDHNVRPQWLINVTNDGWFGRSIGPYQHFAQARLRAIEQGIPIVRSANTGISAIIDSRGRVFKQLELGEAGTIDSLLPVTEDVTVYGRFGDSILLLLSVVGLLPSGIRNFQSRDAREDTLPTGIS